MDGKICNKVKRLERAIREIVELEDLFNLLKNVASVCDTEDIKTISKIFKDKVLNIEIDVMECIREIKIENFNKEEIEVI